MHTLASQPTHVQAAETLPTPIVLRTYALAALAAYTPSAHPMPEEQFLLEHLQAVGGNWRDTLSYYLQQPHPTDTLLLRAANALGLTLLEVLTIALAAAVEDEAMVGRALAHLQAPLGGSRPTLALLVTALASTVSSGQPSLDVLITGNALQSGVLCLQGDAKPLSEQVVSTPLPICLALKDHDAHWPGTTIGIPAESAIPLPPSIEQEAQRHARSFSTQGQQVLVMRTGLPPEGRSVAAVVARAMGSRPLFIETDQVAGLGAWLLLRRLLPVFCLELAPGERKTLPPLPFHRGPVLVVCGPDGSIETSSSMFNWVLPMPTCTERQQLWHIALGDASLAAELARYHRHSSGRIARLGQSAWHYSLFRGQERPTAADVAEAARRGDDMGLEALAQPLRDSVPDEALVIPHSLRAELEALYMRCRVRDALAEGLGISTRTRYFPGVRALLVGASGTGKTLAAGWLATRLGLPLYRVDLAAVTSKYIGETEKNLAQLLARAEHSEVVLLFDEADSLFAKRTDVKDAHDRFANAQTNYLLQRIESFDGIVLLTSNSRARFDTAFARRLDMIIEFPLPGPEERRSLWQSHLGTQHTVTQREINQLAASVDLVGGHIRNAVLAAAVLAHAQERTIKFADVLQGLVGEYRKLGRQMPIELKPTL